MKNFNLNNLILGVGKLNDKQYFRSAMKCVLFFTKYTQF